MDRTVFPVFHFETRNPKSEMGWAPVAQWIEQLPSKQWVGRSSRPRRTNANGECGLRGAE